MDTSNKNETTMASHINLTDEVEEIPPNVTNNTRRQSNHAYNHERGYVIHPDTSQASHSYIYNNPHQNMMPNQFQMGYVVHSDPTQAPNPYTYINPQQNVMPNQFPVGYVMNTSVLPSETHMKAPNQKNRKRQKTSTNVQYNDYAHIPVRRNWNKDEDVALTKAWLHISIDPIIGTDQSSETLWERIHADWKQFLADDFVEDRPTAGLSKRWCTIQAAVNKFQGAYEKCLRRPQSGTNIENLKRDAYKVYQTESVGRKPFLFEHCWDECKKNAKWCNQMASSSKEKPNSSSPPTSTESASQTSNEPMSVGTTDNNSPHVQEIPRPPGRKKSKTILKGQSQENSMLEVFNKINENMERQNNHNKEDLDLKRENFNKEYNLKEQAIQKELELKEKELISQEKELVSQEEERKLRKQTKILNQDLSKLGPAARAQMEKLQERIVEEWNKEDEHAL